MGRNKQQQAASSASKSETTAATAAKQRPSGNKRPRREDSDPSDLNARVLANNKFAALPVQEIPKRVKVPPIFTTTRELAALRNALAERQLHPLYKLCSMGIKIVCSTQADFAEVSKYLLLTKQQYYTHDPPGTKPLKVIIRGLPGIPETNPEQIIDAMKAAKLKPQKIFPIRRMEGVEQRDNLYLAHIERGSVSMADLKKIRVLGDVFVEWERYRPKKRDVTQCGKCLTFGHGTKNCHMRPRCGKCAEEHATSECTTMDEATNLKCANCGANHAAQSRECPKRAEFIKIRQKASTRNQREPRRRPPSPPPMTEEHFPTLRYNVPNLPPLQPNHRQTVRPATSVQHRFAAAAATPSQATPPSAWGKSGRSTSPPGLGNQQRSAPISTPSGDGSTHPLDDGSLFSTKAATELALSLFERLMVCRSKRQQLSAVCDTVQNFLDKYGP